MVILQMTGKNDKDEYSAAALTLVGLCIEGSFWPRPPSCRVIRVPVLLSQVANFLCLYTHCSVLYSYSGTAMSRPSFALYCVLNNATIAFISANDGPAAAGRP